MRTATSLFLAGCLVFLLLSGAQADDSDIFGANVQPNVLILFDSSGSMADEITSIAYDPATTYDVVNRCGVNRNQPCTSTVVYQRTGSNRYELYRNTIADVSSASARDALNTVGFWQGRIGGSNRHLLVGNYLNYQLGFCQIQDCTEPKIDIAKRVVKNLITNVNGVRFGVMKFANNGSEGSGGGGLVAPIGTDVTTMQGAIDNISPSGFTPTGEQLRDAGQYFKGLGSWRGQTPNPVPPSPIELACQPNFVILVSDGLQNGDESGGMQQQATLRRTQDHATWLSGPPLVQNVIVHTVGFDLANTPQALDDLRQTATNGGGSFYSANNAAELEAALQEALRQIVAATFTFATPVLPTTSTTGSNRAYLAAFQSDPSSPFWRGFLKAYRRDANGLVPVDGNGVPLDSYLDWEAGGGPLPGGAQSLRDRPADGRTIYTAATTASSYPGVFTGSLQSFTKSNSAITEALLSASTPGERDQIIDFTRGIDAYDHDVDGNLTEQRAWKLGDIFHSTPVLVTAPTLALDDDSYRTFKDSMANRTKVLIAGANDGMLHAFRESDGFELWAFIPPDLLGRLHELTVRSAEHPFYVDSSPIAADIKVSSDWKTILIFGLRRGGRHYYALDITDTTNPQFMWSVTDPKMGETWSEPAVGKVKVGGVDKFVAFVGGGFDTGENNSTGKAFFVIDLATGEKLWEYTNNATDDRQYMNFSLAANPTAVDLDNNGYVDKVFIGDVGGQLWKFDVAAPATSEWRGKRLFAAVPGQANPPAAGEYYPEQAIYGSPSLAFDTNRKLWVFFGTGDRNHPNNTSQNRFYGFKDDEPGNMTNGAHLTEADLVDVTTTTTPAPEGWFIQLANNEKALASANVFNSVVFFTTFTPTSTVACDSGGGTAKLYALQMGTGFAAVDFNTGEALPTSNASNVRFVTIGSGIASTPVVVLTQEGTQVSTSVVAATTSQQLPSKPIPPPAALKQFLYWREVL